MSTLIENRQIRVFLSSTFRDMQDERDYLMKRTFPKLRRLAASRDVTLAELDLRSSTELYVELGYRLAVTSSFNLWSISGSSMSSSFSALI